MFNVGDRVITNDVWNEKFGRGQIEGIVTKIMMFNPSKCRCKTYVNGAIQPSDKFNYDIKVLKIEGCSRNISERFFKKAE